MTIENQYLTYDEYLSLGGDNIGEMPFQLLEFDARKVIDKYTFNRLVELATQVEEVKLCVYKIINILKSYQSLDKQNRAISSESIDGYSISYTQPGITQIEAKNSELEDIVKTYLINCKLDDGTPYLYRGV